jgi:hypothetical protein
MTNKKFYIYFFPIVIFLCFISLVFSSYLAGPPAGNTNAPGEFSCQGSGGPSCHNGTPNTGPGFSEITIMGGVPAGNYYFPDSSYQMMPYLIDNTKLKGGFQVVALLSNGLNAGTSTITMPMNTQLISSGGFDYVQQTALGAVEPSTLNMHDWMYDWTAPSAGAGTVTFYISFVAADGNNSASGDDIYTDTLVLYEGSVGMNDLNNTQDFTIDKLYPLPANDIVNLDFKSDKNLDLTINVVDIKGRKVILDREIQINSPKSTHQLNIADLNGGIYFINANQKGKPRLQQKLIKFNR